MIYVNGRWGDGTSVVAEVVRRHGFYMGEHGGGDRRCKHGIVEDNLTLAGLRADDKRQVKAGLRQLRMEAHARQVEPGLKCPWLLVRPLLWEVVEEECPPRAALWVTRETKPEEAYTMHTDYADAAKRGFIGLKRRWDIMNVPGLIVPFEGLVRESRMVIEAIAGFLGVEPNYDAAEVVDPNWMRCPV